jgi:hypothetical protein
MDIEIHKERKKLGLTQKELAEDLGVSYQTIQNWEAGKVIPKSKNQILVNYFKNKKPKIQDETLILNEPSEDYHKGVPYYDVDFTASFLEVTNNQSIKPDSYIDHPFFKGCDYVVRASGQSMAKVISHGDAIGLLRVNNWREFFPFGEIYAIVTVDNFRMIKVITKGETDEYYTLISKPTDSKKDEFPPQQIKRSAILSILKVQASSHLF